MSFNGAGNDNSIPDIIGYFQKNPLRLQAANTVLGSIFLGMTSGPLFGWITSILKNIEHPPDWRRYMYESSKTFSICL